MLMNPMRVVAPAMQVGLAQAQQPTVGLVRPQQGVALQPAAQSVVAAAPMRAQAGGAMGQLRQAVQGAVGMAQPATLPAVQPTGQQLQARVGVPTGRVALGPGLR